MPRRGAKTYSGEGLVGLSWAFLRAGARSVIAGLWDVSDMSTANLMADFYTQLAHHATPAEALRKAKLDLLRSKVHIASRSIGDRSSCTLVRLRS